MDLFFLQADTSVVAKAAPKAQNLWEVLVSGGVIMIPLGLLFVAAVYFFFERLIAINRAAKIDDNFMRIIRDHIVGGNVAAARSFSKNNPRSSRLSTPGANTAPISRKRGFFSTLPGTKKARTRSRRRQRRSPRSAGKWLKPS